MKTATVTKFKETDIGLIPEGWSFDRLGNHCKILGGKRLPKEDGLVNQKTNHPYIRITDLGDFGVNESGLKYISDATHTKIKKYIIESGDIYISNVGTIGLVGLVKDNLSGANLTENAVRLTKLTGLNNLFLGYYLKSESGQNQIRQNTVGAVQPKLPIYGVENIKLPIPELIEQKEIAEILSSLDDKIELNRTVNINLEKLASSLFKKWFVDISDELAEGWRIGTFGEAVENFDSKRIPLSSMERKPGLYPYYGATSIMDYVEDYIFDGTYVLLGEDGSVAKEDGEPFVQYVSGKIWVNNHAHVLQGKNGFSTEYIKVFLDQVNITPFVTGAVQPKLNQANMNSIPMVIPDQKTLTKFNEVLGALFGMILENESQTKNLERVRDSLLPRLMNGKIRVSTT